MSLPRKLSLALCLPFLAIVTVFSGTVFADALQYVSGPVCTTVNGWCTTHPLLTVKTVGAVCLGYPQPSQQFQIDVAGWSWSGGADNTPPQAQAGKHYVQVLSDSNSDEFLENDGKTITPNAACGSTTGTPSVVVWQGYIQWDETPPTVSIMSPSNNSNEDTSKITVTGAVSDDASGVASVAVNDVAATLGNGTYSAIINLQTGINTISIVAKDNAGHQASQSETVFLREIPQDKPSASSQTHSDTQTVTQTSNPATASSSNTADTTTKLDTKSQDTKGSSMPSKPTDNLKLVKTVATGTGVSLGTVLSIIIIMLVLDRLGVIEIKLFHNYYAWRKKHYTKLKGDT